MMRFLVLNQGQLIANTDCIEAIVPFGDSAVKVKMISGREYTADMSFTVAAKAFEELIKRSKQL